MAAAPDLSGQWSLKIEHHPEATNNGEPSDCTLRQRGAKLALRCGSNRHDIPGELRGRNVMFRFEKTGIPPMGNDVAVATFTGDLNASGTIINGIMTMVSSVLDEKLRFEMRKQ
jgi:hypothetical protein